MTKKVAIAALGIAVVLGVLLIVAGITQARPGRADQHIHSAVYHRTPAPVRPA